MKEADSRWFYAFCAGKMWGTLAMMQRKHSKKKKDIVSITTAINYLLKYYDISVWWKTSPDKQHIS